MKKIMNIDDLSEIDSTNFESKALSIFRYQAEHCEVYSRFLNFMNINIDSINKLDIIPYLPIEFFKNNEIISQGKTPDETFKSSGTTGHTTSRHLVADIVLYKSSFNLGFKLLYGDIEDYCILGLLPSYLEQGESSLVFMVDELIKKSNHEKSGFYLHDYSKLKSVLEELKTSNTKTILFGVTYALLDVAEQYPMVFENLTIIETGGMKGKRKEIIREELHGILNKGFGTNNLHSEYGMTELLSQAYSQKNGVFHCPPWMKVIIKDLHDPLNTLKQNKTGRIHVIDLANLYSCSFIATNDLGKASLDGGFEVLGRIDHSDIRGCNLMVL